MPEIAEVEIVRRGLAALAGSRLARIEILDPKLETLPVSLIEGKQVVGATRHGKLLGLELSNGDVLAFHLRMTGSLLLSDVASASKKARLRVHLSGAAGEVVLSLVDPRRFGTVALTTAVSFAEPYGPDLFDSALTAKVLAARGGRSKRPLKAVILDQQVLAGVGNYMADETLWAAALSPERPALSLEAADWRRLLQALRRVAKSALKRGGASFSDYRRVDGSAGSMQEAFHCYGRASEPCERCGQVLRKAVVAGRGTTFCPDCQAWPL